MLMPLSVACRSISASSSALKSSRSSAATFCSSWATLDAPAILARVIERNPNLWSYQGRLHVDFRLTSFPYLRQHLEACPGCFKHYGLEERIKALIATKCRGEKAPEALKERLRLEIRRTTIIRSQTSWPS